MMMSQRFPTYFDGILACSPGFKLAKAALFGHAADVRVDAERFLKHQQAAARSVAIRASHPRTHDRPIVDLEVPFAEAGKGHERGQYVGSSVIPFDDREVAAAAIQHHLGQAPPRELPPGEEPLPWEVQP